MKYRARPLSGHKDLYDSRHMELADKLNEMEQYLESAEEWAGGLRGDRNVEIAKKTLDNLLTALQKLREGVAKGAGLMEEGEQDPRFEGERSAEVYRPNGLRRRLEDEGPAEAYPLNGLLCPECGTPQYDTPGGACCKNGHGGLQGVPG
jgi:hypothetical protein